MLVRKPSLVQRCDLAVLGFEKKKKYTKKTNKLILALFTLLKLEIKKVS